MAQNQAKLENMSIDQAYAVYEEFTAAAQANPTLYADQIVTKMPLLKESVGIKGRVRHADADLMLAYVHDAMAVIFAPILARDDLMAECLQMVNQRVGLSNTYRPPNNNELFERMATHLAEEDEVAIRNAFDLSYDDQNSFKDYFVAGMRQAYIDQVVTPKILYDVSLTNDEPRKELLQKAVTQLYTPAPYDSQAGEYPKRLGHYYYDVTMAFGGDIDRSQQFVKDNFLLIPKADDEKGYVVPPTFKQMAAATRMAAVIDSQTSRTSYINVSSLYEYPHRGEELMAEFFTSAAEIVDELELVDPERAVVMRQILQQKKPT